MPKFFSKIPTFVWILILIVPVFVQLIRPGYFWMQDDLQAFRLQQLDKCVKDLQLPCRWIPDMGYQYGYPQFEFYSPSVFYIGELIHLVGFQFIDSIKILFILGAILSAFFMYRLLADWLGGKEAFLGTVFYIYTPFRAVEMYVRGSLNEFWALVCFPLLFWSSMQLIKKKSFKYFLYFSLSLALMLTTHNLMTMIFLPVLSIWILYNLFLERSWKIVVNVVSSGLLGVGLAAFFILPAFFEKQSVHIESLISGYFDYRQHFVTFRELFFSNFFGYGSSELGPKDGISLSTGIIQWVVAVAAIFLAMFFWKKKKRMGILTLGLGLLELFILFLNHEKSSFIWSILEPLKWLQFPWRFLAVSIFLLSLLSALTINYLKEFKFTKYLIVGLIFISIVMNLSFFTPFRWFDISDQDKFSGELWEKQLTISIFDYLPLSSTLPPNRKAPSEPELLDGAARFDFYKKGSNYQVGQFFASGAATLRLPIYDFSGMTARLDGKVISHRNDDCRLEPFCFGLVTVNAPAGAHSISVKLENTMLRNLSNILSLASVMTLIFLGTKKRLFKL